MQLSSDHRFRGYPSGMMESPRTRHSHPVQQKRLPGLLPGKETLCINCLNTGEGIHLITYLLLFNVITSVQYLLLLYMNV